MTEQNVSKTCKVIFRVFNCVFVSGGVASGMGATENRQQTDTKGKILYFMNSYYKKLESGELVIIFLTK